MDLKISHSLDDDGGGVKTDNDYMLRWTNYWTNLTAVVGQYFDEEGLVDVTVTAEGRSIKCHKVILSACSPYFENLLVDNPCQHPTVILKDVTWEELKLMVEFMYRGEVKGTQENLAMLLKVADDLQIRGLKEFNIDSFDKGCYTFKKVIPDTIDKDKNEAFDLRPDRKRKATNFGESPEEKNLFNLPPLMRMRTDLQECQPAPVEKLGSGVHYSRNHSSSNSLPFRSLMSSQFPNNENIASSSVSLTSVYMEKPLPSTLSKSSRTSTMTSCSTGMDGSKMGQTTPDDLSNVKPGILEMIQEERRAKLLEASQLPKGWETLGKREELYGHDKTPNTNDETGFNFKKMPDLVDIKNNNKATKKKCSNNNVDKLSNKNPKSGSKLPSWSQEQLQEAITSVITQRMRFTQASSRFGIPKGTLYDNILGKSRRMKALDEIGLTSSEELAVLEYCCEISAMPYNRRTSRSLMSIIKFLENLKKMDARLSIRKGFKWWWAFCKKYSIISLYFDNSPENENSQQFVKEERMEPEESAEEDLDNDEIDVEGLDETPSSASSNSPHQTIQTPPLFPVMTPSPLLMSSPPPAHAKVPNISQSSVVAAAQAHAALMAFFPAHLPAIPPHHQFMPYVIPHNPSGAPLGMGGTSGRQESDNTSKTPTLVKSPSLAAAK